MDAQIRLDKFLVEMNQGTRTQIKEAAKKGRIQVNGEVIKRSEFKINPQVDQICFDNRKIEYAKTEYYMLNKPQGVVSATNDNFHKTVIDLIGSAKRTDLFPVGRLDIDTEGLLLITNDGELAHRLLSPKKHVDKVYYAEIDGRLPNDAVQQFRYGIILKDGTPTLSAELEVLECTDYDAKIRLTIHEGKFHQVKRMMEAIEVRVTYLKRLSMGSLILDPSLNLGEYRTLTEEEIKRLKEYSV